MSSVWDGKFGVQVPACPPTQVMPMPLTSAEVGIRGATPSRLYAFVVCTEATLPLPFYPLHWTEANILLYSKTEGSVWHFPAVKETYKCVLLIQHFLFRSQKVPIYFVVNVRGPCFEAKVKCKPKCANVSEHFRIRACYCLIVNTSSLPWVSGSVVMRVAEWYRCATIGTSRAWYSLVVRDCWRLIRWCVGCRVGWCRGTGWCRAWL